MLGSYPNGDACDMFWNWCHSRDISKLKVGMIDGSRRERWCNGLLGPCVQNPESIDILGRIHPVGKLKAGFDHLPLREVARAEPCLGMVAHDGAYEPEQRFLRREDLHHARAALNFPVGALLHVVGAQALPVRRREVKVRERVGLCLLEHPFRPRAAPLQHLARCVVHDHGGGGVPGVEDRRDDAPHGAPQLPGADLAYAVAHRVYGASLPGRLLEDLAFLQAPSTCLQPDSSQPIAVTTVVEAMRLPRRHLT